MRAFLWGARRASLPTAAALGLILAYHWGIDQGDAFLGAVFLVVAGVLAAWAAVLEGRKKREGDDGDSG